MKNLKNHLRNLLLVVLTLLLVVLTALNGLAAMGSQSLLRLHRSLTQSEPGYEVRSDDSPAAYPCAVSMSVEGGLVGASYSDRAVIALYEATGALMGRALTGAGGFTALDEAGLIALLEGETLCYSYNGALPLSVLASWMDGASGSDLHASMLLVTREGRLALRTAEQGLLAADTTVDRAAWTRARALLTPAAVEYAGLAGPLYAALAPETLVSAGTISVDTLTSEIPAFDDPTEIESSVQTLLSAFSYSANARSYEERDVQVYVDNDSTLRVGRDGTVHYTAAEVAEGAALDPAGQIAQVRVLLEQAQYSISAGAQAELLAADTRADATTVLLFGLVYEGVPIVQEEPFARVELREGRVMRATLRLRRFTATGERAYLLPAAQAAATLTGHGVRLGVAYLPDEAGGWTAVRCVLE